MTDFVRPYELFSFVLINMSGKQKFIERLGFECLDAIEEFLNLTLSFEKENPPSLQMFVDWVKEGELQIKRDMEGGKSDFVRIMTVHASKGLQAPIVILPDTTSLPSSSRKKRMLWDKDLFYVPMASAQYEANSLRLLEELKQKEHQEYLRLLYVAMTRAEDRLCVCGYTKEKESSWYSFCKKSLQKIGLETVGGDLICECKQQKEAKKADEKDDVVVQKNVPDWLFCEPKSQQEKVTIINPSVLEEDDEAVASPLEQNVYSRGTAIHKLLQVIASVKDENKVRFVKEFLTKQLPLATEKDIIKTTEDINALLNKYGFLFAENSRAEMPIMGELDGSIVSGQIDRVVFQEDRVIIIDYKTNRRAAQTITDVPQKYVKQMRLYKCLMEKMFPDKKVEAYLLWVASCDLMKIF
jgi:ATP-dependent helicase/nuclease subunit A